MAKESWAFEGDGDLQEGFEDRSAAIRAAAAHFQLTISEVQELSRDGLVSLSQHTFVKVFEANDNDDYHK